jgi:hypothetical protein
MIANANAYVHVYDNIAHSQTLVNLLGRHYHISYIVPFDAIQSDTHNFTEVV